MYKKKIIRDASLPIWRSIFISIVSFYTLRVYLGFYAYDAGICGGALGSGFYCDSSFFEKAIIHPEVLMISMFFFGMPLVLPVVAIIMAFLNCKSSRTSTKKYSNIFFYLNILFILILLPIIVLILGFIVSAFLVR